MARHDWSDLTIARHSDSNMETAHVVQLCSRKEARSGWCMLALWFLSTQHSGSAPVIATKHLVALLKWFSPSSTHDSKYLKIFLEFLIRSKPAITKNLQKNEALRFDKTMHSKSSKLLEHPRTARIFQGRWKVRVWNHVVSSAAVSPHNCVQLRSNNFLYISSLTCNNTKQDAPSTLRRTLPKAFAKIDMYMASSRHAPCCPLAYAKKNTSKSFEPWFVMSTCTAQSLPKHFPVPKRFRINPHKSQGVDLFYGWYRNQRNTKNMNRRWRIARCLTGWISNVELIRPFFSLSFFGLHLTPRRNHMTTAVTDSMLHLYAKQVEGGTDAQRIDAHQVQEDLATDLGSPPDLGSPIWALLTLLIKNTSICFDLLIWYRLHLSSLSVFSCQVLTPKRSRMWPLTLPPGCFSGCQT